MRRVHRKNALLIKLASIIQVKIVYALNINTELEIKLKIKMLENSICVNKFLLTENFV